MSAELSIVVARVITGPPELAEAWQSRLGVGGIEVARLVEELTPPRIYSRNLVENDLEIRVAERAEVARGRELAVRAEHRRLPHLQVDVAGGRGDGVTKHGAEVHGQLVHRHDRNRS